MRDSFSLSLSHFLHFTLGDGNGVLITFSHTILVCLTFPFSVVFHMCMHLFHIYLCYSVFEIVFESNVFHLAMKLLGAWEWLQFSALPRKNPSKTRNKHMHLKQKNETIVLGSFFVDTDFDNVLFFSLRLLSEFGLPCGATIENLILWSSYSDWISFPHYQYLSSGCSGFAIQKLFALFVISHSHQ